MSALKLAESPAWVAAGKICFVLALLVDIGAWAGKRQWNLNCSSIFGSRKRATAT
jgi:hypothetical protein